MDKTIGAIGYCSHCFKLSYPNRKAARRVTNIHSSHKAPYRCPVNDIFWHVGELPPSVIRGYVDRGTYFREVS